MAHFQKALDSIPNDAEVQNNLAKVKATVQQPAIPK